MTNEERLEYAESKLNEAIENDNVHDILYWRGYRDGVLRAHAYLQRINLIKDDEGKKFVKEHEGGAAK